MLLAPESPQVPYYCDDIWIVFGIGFYNNDIEYLRLIQE